MFQVLSCILYSGRTYFKIVLEMLKTLLKIFDYSWTMRCEQSTQWQPAGNSTNKRAVRNFPLQIWKCICKFSKVVFSTFDNSVREEQNKTSYRFLQIISTRNWPIQVISQFNTVGTVLVQNVPFKVVTESAVSVLIQIQNLGSKIIVLPLETLISAVKGIYPKSISFHFGTKQARKL